MLNKFKELSDSKLLIEDLGKNLDEQKNAVAALQESIGQLQQETQTMKEAVKTLAQVSQETNQELQNAITTARDLHVELKEDVLNVRVLRGQMQNRVVERLDEELLAIADQTKERLQSFSAVSEDADHFSRRFDAAAKEILRFNDIAQRIKEKDFELNGYARELQRREKEKIELIRKVDSLERLAASLRRKR